MSAGAFDTLTAARDLEAAGFERRKAEAGRRPSTTTGPPNRASA